MRLIQLVGLSTFLLLFINTARAGQPAPPVLHPGDVPIGWLGYPLGTYLTIEGQREEWEGPKMGTGRFLVDTINRKKLDKPAAIGIDNLETLPGGVRCVINGYETMRMIGAPPASEQAAKEAGKPFLPPQAGWQAQCYFVALSVVAPKDINSDKLEKAQGQTQFEMNENAAREAKAADKVLNDSYEKLAAMLDQTGKEKLKAAQRAWIKFRDAEYDLSADEYRGGTMMTLAHSLCLRALTEERTVDLKRHIESRKEH